MNKDARFTERSPKNTIHEGQSKASQPPQTRHVPSIPNSEHANMIETTTSSSSVLLPCKRKLSYADETPKCNRRIPTVKRAKLRTVFTKQQKNSAISSKESHSAKPMDLDPFVKRNFRDTDDNYYDRPLEPLYPELTEKTLEKANHEGTSQVLALLDTETSLEASLLPYPDLIQEVSKFPLKPDISVTCRPDDSAMCSLSPQTHPNQPTIANNSWFQPQNTNGEYGNGAFKITSCFKNPTEQSCKLTMKIRSSELETVVAECGPKGIMKSSHRSLGHEDKENSKVDSKRLKTCKPADVEDCILVNLSDGITTKPVVNAAPTKPRMFTGVPVNK